MKRRLLITTIILSLVLGITAFAGTWTGSYETGWRYQNDNGTYVANSWMQDADGQWYYFGPNGIMLHDTWVEGLYYLGSTGAMLTNTTTPDGYQVGADGKWIPGAGQQAAAQEQAAAANSADFNYIVELFRQAMAEANDETVQGTNVRGENNNTLVMDLNINSAEAAGMEELLVAVTDAAMREEMGEYLNLLSNMYGQRVYLRITYYVNGRAYSTKTY